jgi:hypothetical protein
MKRSVSVSLVAMMIVLLFTMGFAQDDPTVYVTRTGSKYHRAGCTYLRSSSIPIKLSAASGRYSACSRCNPPLWKSGNKMPGNVGQSVSPSGQTHTGEKAIGTTPTGKTVYEGPRGGHYHYSKSGKKVYEKKKR